MMDDRYETVFDAFHEYARCRKRFVESMQPLGIVTCNVDPLVDFAELVVARELGGRFQRRANKDVDSLRQTGFAYR